MDALTMHTCCNVKLTPSHSKLHSFHVVFEYAYKPRMATTMSNNHAVT